MAEIALAIVIVVLVILNEVAKNVGLAQKPKRHRKRRH